MLSDIFIILARKCVLQYLVHSMKELSETTTLWYVFRHLLDASGCFDHPALRYPFWLKSSLLFIRKDSIIKKKRRVEKGLPNGIYNAANATY